MPDVCGGEQAPPATPRSRTFGRPRLQELFELGSDATLLLVSAPAGFGKTTLLGTWLADGGHGRPTAWVSLHERDRSASTFWTYVLLAVDRAAPGTATAALAQLRSGHAPIETVLTTLLNELSVQPRDLNLALDDYHLAEGPEGPARNGVPHRPLAVGLASLATGDLQAAHEAYEVAVNASWGQAPGAADHVGKQSSLPEVPREVVPGQLTEPERPDESQP